MPNDIVALKIKTFEFNYCFELSAQNFELLKFDNFVEYCTISPLAPRCLYLFTGRLLYQKPPCLSVSCRGFSKVCQAHDHRRSVLSLGVSIAPQPTLRRGSAASSHLLASGRHLIHLRILSSHRRPKLQGVAAHVILVLSGKNVRDPLFFKFLLSYFDFQFSTQKKEPQPVIDQPGFTNNLRNPRPVRATQQTSASTPQGGQGAKMCLMPNLSCEGHRVACKPVAKQQCKA